MNHHKFSKAVICDGIRTEKELCSVIVQIVDSLIDDHRKALKELEQCREMPGMELEKMAKISEMKIRIQEIKRIKNKVQGILKRSTNKMIVATIDLKML